MYEMHLVEYHLKFKDFDLIFNIYTNEGMYDIELSFTYYDRVEDITVLSLEITEDEYSFTKEHLIKKGPFTLDASFDVHYYDRNYHEIDREDSIDFEDSLFRSYFNVPEEKAREYRLNFQKYRKEINQQVILDKMTETDEEKSYAFRPPFTFESLESFFKIDATKDYDYIDYQIFYEDEDLIKLENDEYKVGEEKELSISFNEQKWQWFCQFFSNYFGADGEYIISDNLVCNLSLYFMVDELGTIETTGFIIRKIDDSFTLYSIHFSSQGVYAMSKEITKSELEYLFCLDDINQETFGLRTFLGNSFGGRK